MTYKVFSPLTAIIGVNGNFSSLSIVEAVTSSCNVQYKTIQFSFYYTNSSEDIKRNHKQDFSSIAHISVVVGGDIYVKYFNANIK